MSSWTPREVLSSQEAALTWFPTQLVPHVVSEIDPATTDPARRQLDQMILSAEAKEARIARRQERAFAPLRELLTDLAECDTWLYRGPGVPAELPLHTADPKSKITTPAEKTTRYSVDFGKSVLQVELWADENGRLLGRSGQMAKPVSLGNAERAFDWFLRQIVERKVDAPASAPVTISEPSKVSRVMHPFRSRRPTGTAPQLQ